MDCSLPGFSVHGNSPDKNIGGGCHALLQRIFPTQGSNPGLPHCRQILYSLSQQESPRILEWVAYPFSRGTSQLKNQTRVSCIAGRFFTSWATREAPWDFYIYLYIPYYYMTYVTMVSSYMCIYFTYFTLSAKSKWPNYFPLRKNRELVVLPLILFYYFCYAKQDPMQVQLLPKRGLGMALIYSLLTLVSSLPISCLPGLETWGSPGAD